MRVRDRPKKKRKPRRWLRVWLGPYGLIYLKPNRWKPWRLLAWADFSRGPIRCMAELDEVAYTVPKKPEIAAGQGGAAPAAKVGGRLQRFPGLRGVLTDLLYEGTTERRKPGSLTIRADGGLWTAILRDPSSGMMLRVSAEAYDDLEPALDALLTAKVVPWEIDPYARPEGPRKGKRGA